MREVFLSAQKNFTVLANSAVVISDDASIMLAIKPIKQLKECRVDLRIGKNCKVSIFLIQESETSIIQNNYVGEDSVLHSYGLWLCSGSGEIVNHLVGKNSEAYDLQIFSEKETSKLHINSVLRHANLDTKGNILVRGVAKDSASVKLDGMIRIEKNSGGANSFLTQNVILLNTGAHATANPELEIENNNVSSRHSASVSQIDEEKIFYLMSRGISREEAKKIIVDGFLEAIIEKIEDSKIRSEIFQRSRTL